MPETPTNDYAATTLRELRDLLSNLHHESSQQSGHDGELFRGAEETIRWLLDEYLKRGEMVLADG